MKLYLLIVGMVAGLVLVNGAISGTGSCSIDKGTCTSLFSGFPHVQSDLNKYTKQMLDKSYDFLLLSSAFDVYSLDRPGFEKLYRKVSDKAWEDTIELIKYQSRRGGYVQLGEEGSTSVHDVASLLQSNETSSLGLALEYEKLLATEAHRMHKKISHADSKRRTIFMCTGATSTLYAQQISFAEHTDQLSHRYIEAQLHERTHFI